MRTARGTTRDMGLRETPGHSVDESLALGVIYR
jgi:hypothetical protein